jgi:hypothetical protein
MTLTGILYVVTCGQCGQTWHRASAVDGQAMECIFCGRTGRVSMGPGPGAASSGAPRVEAWLMH